MRRRSALLMAGLAALATVPAAVTPISEPAVRAAPAQPTQEKQAPVPVARNIPADLAFLASAGVPLSGRQTGCPWPGRRAACARRTAGRVRRMR